MPGVYGGDEISALVIDAGYTATRAGWAGEDTPRVVLPSSYGYVPMSDEELAALEADAAYQGDETQQANGTEAASSTTEGSDERLKSYKAKSASKALSFMVDRQKKRRRFVGDNDLNLFRKGMEVAPIFDEHGIVSELPAFASACNFALEQLSCDAREHPLLLTEPAWNNRESRESLTELAFETLQTPAFYLANRSVLSSFAAGKPTSLVIDIGGSSVSSIPIVDGFILRKGIQRQNNAGDAINKALLYSLHNDRASDASSAFAGVTPQYLIKSRSSVDPNAPANVVLRQDRVGSTTDSYKAYQVGRTMNDFKESVAQVLETPWDEEQAQFRSGRMYEFPDGYNDAFGLERLKAPEMLFNPQLWKDVQSDQTGPILTPGKNYSGLTEMVMNSINAVDVDSRPSLFGNIVVVGGTSFIPGLVDRLSYELAIHAPNQKVKIHSPGNTTERRHSSWLGGSILASLGTFHQLWISKQEYEEHGSAIVHARCK